MSTVEEISSTLEGWWVRPNSKKDYVVTTHKNGRLQVLKLFPECIPNICVMETRSQLQPYYVKETGHRWSCFTSGYQELPEGLKDRLLSELSM